MLPALSVCQWGCGGERPPRRGRDRAGDGRADPRPPDARGTGAGGDPRTGGALYAEIFRPPEENDPDLAVFPHESHRDELVMVDPLALHPYSCRSSGARRSPTSRPVTDRHQRARPPADHYAGRSCRSESRSRLPPSSRALVKPRRRRDPRGAASLHGDGGTAAAAESRPAWCAASSPAALGRGALERPRRRTEARLPRSTPDQPASGLAVSVADHARPARPAQTRCVGRAPGARPARSVHRRRRRRAMFDTIPMPPLLELTVLQVAVPGCRRAQRRGPRRAATCSRSSTTTTAGGPAIRPRGRVCRPRRLARVPRQRRRAQRLGAGGAREDLEQHDRGDWDEC